MASLAARGRPRSPSPPAPPIAASLLEMGFSIKHIRQALAATGTTGDVTAHGINSLATWMIEHPCDAEETGELVSLTTSTTTGTPVSEPPTPQTPEAIRPPLHRERQVFVVFSRFKASSSHFICLDQKGCCFRSDPELTDPDRRPLADMLETADWEEVEREHETRDRVSHRRYGARRHLASDIRNYFTIRPGE